MQEPTPQQPTPQKKVLKSSRWLGVGATLVAVALSLGACSSTRTAGEQVDDGWITTKIESKLTSDPEVSAWNVDVDTLDGVVTLRGKVTTDVAKQEAEELARETKGVKHVINEIIVEPETTTS
jgi:hyperosmotically inducible periplasmic protein